MDPDPDKQLKNVLEWIISWMEWYFSKAPEKEKGRNLLKGVILRCTKFTA